MRKLVKCFFINQVNSERAEIFWRWVFLMKSINWSTEFFPTETGTAGMKFCMQKFVPENTRSKIRDTFGITLKGRYLLIIFLVPFLCGGRTFQMSENTSESSL